MEAETRYARSGDVGIAYQVTGDGLREAGTDPAGVCPNNRYWDSPPSGTVPPSA
jgi:hypothetical protein